MAYKVIASQCSGCSACEPECPNSLHGRLVGSFGDLSVFDVSQPSALCCGEGGMEVTDDDALTSELRCLR
jgi:dTDP-4-amino-4,6-dideoxygalactose transaminase